MFTPREKAIGAFLRPLGALLLALLVFQGYKALNRLCGSARGRVPIIGSVSANTITFAEVQQGFLLSATGSQFVPSSVADSRRFVQFLECDFGDILVRVPLTDLNHRDP